MSSCSSSATTSRYSAEPNPSPVCVAATAHNATIYTRNPDDLTGLDDLITIAPT